MKYYLLLGAGFSRNWGGWLAAEALEYLLGHPEIMSNPDLRRKLMHDRGHGGYESTLADYQSRGKAPSAYKHRLALESAISEMFYEMNMGLLAKTKAEFDFKNNERGQLLSDFVAKFDAIFTLNQDLLFERLYLGRDLTIGSAEKWSGVHMPGVRRISGTVPPMQNNLKQTRWEVRDDLRLEPNFQPYIKLHGSSNWVSDSGDEMLIMGGGKSRIIESIPLLRKYHVMFRECLSADDTRLMVIGYGFADDHINDVIGDAGKMGLRIFIVDPKGVDVLKESPRAKSDGSTDIEEYLIGASRRSLAETFVNDQVEHGKLMRFFD